MANTLATARASIQAKGYGTDTAAVQLSMVNSVYRRVAAERRWYWLQATDTTLTVALNAYQTSLTGLTALRTVDGVRINDEPLEYCTPAELHDLRVQDRATGAPLFWTQYGSNLEFWPTADSAYTLSIDYTKNITALAVDADTTLIPDEFQDVLVWGSIKELTFRERDMNGRAIANEEYNNILRDMRHANGLRQRQTSREVVWTGEIERVNDGFNL